MSGLDLAALGLRAAEPAGSSLKLGSNDLGQGDFLTLLVTQLKNQDPLNPLENEAFVAQLAQFSTLSATTEAAETLGRLEALFASGERASAASWIGRNVTLANGASGEVQSVSFEDDGALSLNLADGSRHPLSSVSSLS